MHQIRVLNRREMLLFASGACLQSWSLMYAGDSDFWNKKEPSEWTSEEVGRLTSKSPWAKEITASSAGNGRPMGRRGMGGGGMGRGGGMGYPGGGGGVGYPGGGVGYPGSGGGSGYPSGGGAGMQFHGVVRWESAKPVLEALKTPLPEAFANHYVISVSGIPILSGRQRHSENGDTDDTVSKAATEDVLEHIKDLTYLEPKGKSPAQPGVVQLAASSTAMAKTVLFGFSKELLSLSADDKEATFTSQFGSMQIHAKFSFKEMSYRKALAI